MRRQEDNDSWCRIRTQLIGHRVRTRDDAVFVGEWFVKRRQRRETIEVIFGLVGLVEFRLNGRNVNGGFLVTHASVQKLQRRSLAGALSCPAAAVFQSRVMEPQPIVVPDLSKW